MTRLGSVLSGILTEFAKAQASADQLIRNQITESENDPILSSLSSKRVVFGDARIVLRFLVNEISPSDPVYDPKDLAVAWTRFLAESGLQEEVNSIIVSQGEIPIKPRPSKPLIPLNVSEAALVKVCQGDTSQAINEIREPIDKLISNLPREQMVKASGALRSAASRIELGFKEFQTRKREVSTEHRHLESELEIDLDRQQISTSNGYHQEIHFTVNFEDIESILPESSGG